MVSFVLLKRAEFFTYFVAGALWRLLMDRSHAEAHFSARRAQMTRTNQRAGRSGSTSRIKSSDL